MNNNKTSPNPKEKMITDIITETGINHKKTTKTKQIEEQMIIT
ncbi:MAG: hypothetical protein RR623_06535 [Bacilli bacterium]